MLTPRMPIPNILPFGGDGHTKSHWNGFGCVQWILSKVQGFAALCFSSDLFRARRCVAASFVRRNEARAFPLA